jgi:HPt (histidine-containing phosphotransfer) domain-containing protein
MFLTSTAPIISTFSDDSDMRELVEMFVAEVPDKITAFETYASTRNWPKLRQLSHQLKGSAGGYGFDEVTPLAQSLENAVRSQQPDVEAVDARIQQLVEVLRRLSV